MTEQLEINLQYLYTYQKHLYRKIEAYLENQQQGKFELYITEDNFVNLIYNKNDNESFFIYDEQEVNQKTWLQEHEVITSGFHEIVMLGFGLSYHLADLVKTNPELNIYIYEPRIDIFLEALKVVNIKDVLEQPQVKMFSIGQSEEDIKEFLYYRNSISTFSFYNICVPFYIGIDEQCIKSFYKMDYEQTKSDIAVLSFHGIFGKLPFQNGIKNLYYVNKTVSLEVLKNRYEGCTALVVGAGPSLEPEIEVIKHNKDNVLIIAAGSAIQSLLHHGIKPHLVVTMDPGEANGRVFENVDYSNIPVAYSTQVYPQIIQNKKNGLFHFALNSEPLANNLLTPEVKPSFYTTSTVSGVTLQVASFLGASTIILVGQDASFPNNQYYASGASHLIQSNIELTLNNSNLTVKNVSGGFNKTNFSMNMAREGIEKVIKLIELKTRQIYNASSLGAVIEGAPYASLSEMLKERLGNSYNFDELMELSSMDSLISQNKYDIRAGMESIINEVNDLESYCKITIRLVNEFELASRKSFNAANNKLTKLEDTFRKVNNSTLFTEYLTLWCRLETRQYDANVKYIDQETSMIKKSKLLREILIPYVEIINEILIDVKNECSDLLEEIK